MKAKFIPLIAVLAILCSCTPSKTNEGYEDYDWTALEKRLENPIKIPIDTMLDVSMKMRTLGDKVLMECPYRQVLYELKDNRLQYKNVFIKEGQGPLEVLTGANVNRMNDGRFVAIEPGGSKKIFVSRTADEKELEDISTWHSFIRQDEVTEYFCQTLLPINDTLLLGSALGNCPSKFVVNNLNTGESVPLNYSFPEVLDNLADFAKTFALDGRMYKKPDENKYVYYCLTGLYSFIFDYQDGKMENMKYIFNQPAAYESRGEKARPRLCDGKSVYAADCYVAKEHIYYSNRRATVEDVFKLETTFEGYPYYYTREFIVFDWNGKPVRKYVLDRMVSDFFVDEDESIFYGMTIDSPDSEEEYLVAYKL